MTDLMPISRAARVRAWVRDHQRSAGLLAAAVALAVVAALVLVGISLFSAPLPVSQTDPTAKASPSGPSSEPPARSAEPSETAAPPPDGPPIVWPPQPDGGWIFFEGIWGVSVVDELNIRSGSGTEHAAIGQLDAGDLFVVLASPLVGSDSGLWLQIAAEDGVVGYVSPGPNHDPYLVSTPIPWMASWQAITGVASNGSTYVAYGTRYDLEYPPYEGGDHRPLLLTSDDGVTWTPSEDLGGSVRTVTGGAEGWVALTYVYPDNAVTWFSEDGRTWEETQSQLLGAESIAYGRAGWVAMSGNDALRSRDGRTWSDPASTPLRTDGAFPEIEGSEAGYVTYVHNCCDAHIAVSLDGVTWHAVTLPIENGDWFSDVELAGDRILVLITDSDTGGTWLHRGTLAENGMVTWDEPPAAIDADSLRVDSISQGPDGLLAMGWDTEALLPVLWASSDGATWERLDTVPNALGGSVGPEPAWGSGGWVGIGSALGSIGQQLWRSEQGEGWTAVGPTIGYAPDALPCAPAADVSILTLAYSGALAEQCYGDASLTIRAWVPVIDGLGGCCWPDPDPAWLAGTYPRTWLVPGQTNEIRASVPIYLPPGIDDGALVGSTWVEVTGHFRDPVAQDCRQAPLSSYPHRLTSLEDAQLACRQRFVVESIVAADGP